MHGRPSFASWALVAAAVAAAVAPAGGLELRTGADLREARTVLANADNSLAEASAALNEAKAQLSEDPWGGPFWEPEKPYYRSWDERFDIKPFNISANNPPGTKENRDGYREFMKANPRHAVAPNSRDRNAESTVVTIFTVAVFLMIIAILYLTNKIQEVSEQSEKKGICLFTECATAVVVIPWLLVELWILRVVCVNFWTPCRESVARGHCHWMCSFLIWYLLIAPLLTLANILFLVMVFEAHPPKQQEAFMGGAEHGRPRKKWNPPKWLRICFAVAECIFQPVCVFIVWYWSDDRTFCEPDLWYTAACLALITFVVLVLGCCALIGWLIWEGCIHIPIVKDLIANLNAASGGDGEIPSMGTMVHYTGFDELMAGPQAAPLAAGQKELVAQTPPGQAQLRPMPPAPPLSAVDLAPSQPAATGTGAQPAQGFGGRAGAPPPPAAWTGPARSPSAAPGSAYAT